MGHRVTWQAPLQTFGTLCRTCAKWRQINHILQTFLSAKQRTVSPIPADDLREIATQNVNRCCCENFWNKLSKFFWKGVISRPPKNSFLGFLGYTCGTSVAALAFMPTTNLSIAPYSRRAKDACSLLVHSTFATIFTGCLLAIALILFKLCLLSWKTIHTAHPPYLSELITHYLPPRALRSSNTNLLARPSGITSNFTSRAFSVSAPSNWNWLPVLVRSLYKLSIFKRHLFQSTFAVYSPSASAADSFYDSGAI